MPTVYLRISLILYSNLSYLVLPFSISHHAYLLVQRTTRWHEKYYTVAFNDKFRLFLLLEQVRKGHVAKDATLSFWVEKYMEFLGSCC